ncbi:toxin [Cumulibacter soli]|uniref:toxin n=1 Tax=Cumulibacter soli TaxID=2546344 RepID=UPI001067C874|nr:toxin [Cumulibacter soli]
MRVHPSAREHGIEPEDAIQAATWATWIADLDDDSPARQLRLGFDTHGRMLETVVLVFDSGNELGVYAMKARPQMLDLLP